MHPYIHPFFVVVFDLSLRPYIQVSLPQLDVHTSFLSIGRSSILGSSQILSSVGVVL